MRQPGSKIVFQPNVRRGFQRGIRQVVDAVRPTLGPLPRSVANARVVGSGVPELLDDGAVIARRIIELPDRTENAGAMMARHMLWKLHETVGDGTATAAVLFGAIYDQGARYLASGGNAMALRSALEACIEPIIDALDAQTTPLDGKAALEQLAQSVCHDAELATALADIFDVTGMYGRIDVRSGRTRGLETEFVDGTYWKSGVFSDKMIDDKLRNRRQLKNVAILVSDLDLKDPRDLVPLMQAAVRPEIDGLVIVAKSISEALIGLLVANQRPGQFEIVAVRVPGKTTVEQFDNLTDLAVLTGARPIFSAAGEALAGVRHNDLGQARRIWADGDYFGIVTGKGDPCALRQRIVQTQARIDSSSDPAERSRLMRRLAVLLGGSAVLKVGTITKLEGDYRLNLAQRTVDAVRSAMREGVVVGAGVALLNCRTALARQAAAAQDPDQCAALGMLCRALEAPARTIAQNAGYEPATIVATAEQGAVFDVKRGQAVESCEAGIFDSAGVLKAVVTTAIRTAALALTTDTLVLPKAPSTAAAP